MANFLKSFKGTKPLVLSFSVVRGFCAGKKTFCKNSVRIRKPFENEMAKTGVGWRSYVQLVAVPHRVQ